MISFRSHHHNVTQELIVITTGSDRGAAYFIHQQGIEFMGEISFCGHQHCFIELPPAFSVIGDILSVHPDGTVRKLLSAASDDNTLFVTGQCNNHCLMCSQPPTRKDDLDYFFCLNMFIIDHLPSRTVSLGITGGEPTLSGTRLPWLIKRLFERQSGISLHMLTNGRRFVDKSYARQFAEFASNDLVTGIPIHSDYVGDHDYIAGVKGAFNQTMSGLYNLALFNLKVEIRIVVNLRNYRRLPQLADYIFRNIPFARHVVFMGLEDTGLAAKNRNHLWIDPVDYAPYLEEAVIGLALWGMNTSIYNIPLCLLPKSLHEFAQRSITDWKESYTPACADCTLKKQCCGLFSTSLIQSKSIRPISQAAIQE